MSKFDIATEMNSIMAGPVFQTIYAKPQPQFEKTAAKKEDDKKAKEKAEKEKAAAKEKAEKEKAKEKAEKEKAKAKAEKAKAKKKAMTKYEACIKNLCTASEILDEAGLSKASALTLLALDSLVTTAAKKKEEAKGKKYKKDEKKSEKKDDKKDKNDAKGPPAFLKGKKDEKKDKKDEKKDSKKVKKASDEEGCADCGMAEDVGDHFGTGEYQDAEDNPEFADLMRELEKGEGEGDWDVLEQPANELEDVDPDDPELTSLVENLEEGASPDEKADPLAMLASKKTSLQKLAEELGTSFLA